MLLTALALAAALTVQTPPDDGPIATAQPSRVTESAEALRRREAMAYAWPLQAGMPTDDFGFAAWCVGLISGYVAIAETVPEEDPELLRLARLEKSDFSEAYAIAAPRHTAAERAAAEHQRELGAAPAQPYITNTDRNIRVQAFNSFAGLPGRCEHAARRIRDNIITPPATLAQVGLTVEQVVPPEVIERTRQADAANAAAAGAANAPAPAATASTQTPAPASAPASSGRLASTPVDTSTTTRPAAAPTRTPAPVVSTTAPRS